MPRDNAGVVNRTSPGGIPIPDERGPLGTDAIIEAVTKQIAESLTAGEVEPAAVASGVISTLSALVPGMWVLTVMKRDPAQLRVFVADGEAPALKRYVESYLAALYQPGEADTVGVSQSVIEQRGAVVMPNLTLEEYLSLVSPRGQAYIRQHPFPIPVESVNVLVVPMSTLGAVIGTLGHIDFDSAHGLDSRDVVWMQRVADRTALAVGLAELNQTTTTRQARLAALSVVASMVGSTREVRSTLDLVLEQLRGKVQIDAADALVLDRATAELVVTSSLGFHATATLATRFMVPQELWILPRDELRSGAQSVDLIRRSGRRPLFIREGFQAYRFVPMMGESMLLGAIELFGRSELKLDGESIAFVEALAALGALAVERAAGPPTAGKEVAAGALPDRPPFSEREQAILRLLLAGSTNQEIADGLHLSRNTVKFHLRKLLDKAGVSNRTELASRVSEFRWLEPAP